VNIPTPSGQNSVWVRVTFTSCDESEVSVVTLVLWESNCLRGGIRPVKLGGTGSIVPNPFTDQTQFHFTAEESTNAQMGIYNVAGRLIYSKELVFSKGKNVVLLNDLPAHERGVLYYQITSEQGILSDGKILRQD